MTLEIEDIKECCQTLRGSKPLLLDHLSDAHTAESPRLANIYRNNSDYGYSFNRLDEAVLTSTHNLCF